MVDRRPTPDADTDLAAITGLLRAENWPGLDGWMFSGVTSRMTQADFQAGIATSFASHGHITAATIVTQPTYGSGRGGFDSASAKLNVTFAEPGGAHTYAVSVSLVWESNSWKVVSMAVAS